jgi:predicted lipase
LLFEYITLFIHPFVAEITHHSPFLEIIIFVCIGALVVPAHHRIEHWFIKKLTNIHQKHAMTSTPINDTLETTVIEQEQNSITEMIEEPKTTDQTTETPTDDTAV